MRQAQMYCINVGRLPSPACYVTNPPYRRRTGQAPKSLPCSCSFGYGVKLITSVIQVPLSSSREHSVMVARSLCPRGS